MKNTSMIIRRADITKNFTIIPNQIAQSKNITANAKSLLVHLLSMPNDWYYVKTQFWRQTNLSRDVFNRAWNELKDLGYIQAERIKEGNLVRGYHYIISDLPIFGLTEAHTVRESVSNKRNNNKETDYKKIGNKEAKEANKLDSLPIPNNFENFMKLNPNLTAEQLINLFMKQ